MTTTNEFGTNLPQKILVKNSQQRTIVFSQLSESDIILEENSTLTLAGVINKGSAKNHKISFKLSGKNADLKFVAIIIGKNSESFNFETISQHLTPKTKAFFGIFSAMFDSSSIDYKGNIIIEPEAKKTNSYLSHKTLLLSENSKASTLPCLEIKTDDVSTSHSATVGHSDENTLYYLASRGLDKKTAIRLMVEGFLDSATSLIPDKIIRKILMEEIENLIARQNP